MTLGTLTWSSRVNRRLIAFSGAVLAVGLAMASCEEYAPEEDIALLQSMQSHIREQAAGRLVRRGEEVVPQLIEAAGSEYTTVRFEVARLLGRIRDPRGAAALIGLLEDRASFNVAATAAWALGEIRAPESLSPLMRYPGSPSKDVRAYVVGALGQCYTDSVSAALGDSVLAAILGALRDPAPKVRVAALLSAQELGYRNAVDQVIRLSRDPSPKVRHVAVQALGQIGTGEVPRSPGPVTGRVRANIVEALLAALDDAAYQSIRTKAVRALEKIGAPEAIPHLERLRRSGTEEDQRESTRVLEELRAPPNL